MKYGVIAARGLDLTSFHNAHFSVLNSIGWVVDGADQATRLLRGILSYPDECDLESFNLYWNTRLATDLVPGCEDAPRKFQRQVESPWPKTDSGFLIGLTVDRRYCKIATIDIPHRVKADRPIMDGTVLTWLVSREHVRKFISDPEFPLVEVLELSSLG